MLAASYIYSCMPAPHFELKRISRTPDKSRPERQRSATGAAAYRAADRIADERTKTTHDYTRKKGVVYSEIIAPEGADWFEGNRSILWNAAEKAEKRKDACVAREIIAALPRELDSSAHILLAHSFVQTYISEQEHVACDLSIHASTASDGRDNPHIHVLFTTRCVTENGFAKKKNLHLDKETTLRDWRAAWQQHVNHYLRKHGAEERLDMRSLKEQGIPREPEPKIGVVACNMEKQGYATDKGDRWREVRHQNTITSLAHEVGQKEIEAEQLTAAQQRTSSLFALARKATGRV